MQPDQQRELLKLLSDPRLARVMAVLHDKLSKCTELKGRLTRVTRDESDALLDILPRRVKEGGSLALKEIDRLLREETGFHCSLERAVELHRRAPIVRPKEIRARYAAARDRAVRRCFGLIPGLDLPQEASIRVGMWLNAAQKDLRAGYRKWNEDGLLEAVRAVALVFGRLPGRGSPPVYLAELANEVAGNAHALDAGQPAGTLLLRALAFHYPETAHRERRGSAAWRANLLSEGRIARDPISVRVDTFGLRGEITYLHEMRHLTLSRSVNLDDFDLIGGEFRAWRGVAFIVENPTVFARLIKHVRGTYVPECHPTLICTNGNLNLADRAVLRALRDGGAHLYYAGDFDARGLQIACAVLEEFGEAASPWRMTPDDYRAALRGDRGTLDTAKVQRSARYFPELVRDMSERRQVAHQESLAGRLEDDLEIFIRRGITPPRRRDEPGATAAVSALR